MTTPPFLTGQFLLAMPGMSDLRFEKAVIAICAHDEDGAMGIGIEHERSNIRLHRLLKQLDIDPGKAPDVPVHHGGPVEPGRGFVLHSRDWGGQESIEVANLGVLTGTLDVLRAIAAGTGPSRFVVALGYAGWAAGQLDGEMTRHGWFAAPGSEDILFETKASARWEKAFAKAGIDPRLLASEGGIA